MATLWGAFGRLFFCAGIDRSALGRSLERGRSRSALRFPTGSTARAHAWRGIRAPSALGRSPLYRPLGPRAMLDQARFVARGPCPGVALVARDPWRSMRDPWRVALGA
jgi:hypothetical protein